MSTLARFGSAGRLVVPRSSRIDKAALAGGLLVALAAGVAPGPARAEEPKAASKGAAPAASAAAPKPALTVTVVQPQTSTLSQVIAANGSIAAWQEASIGAESNGWRLAELRAAVGDRVKRGQVLAVFATDMAQADLAQQRASVAEAEAVLAEARANAQRARDLAPSGVISAQQTNQILTAERTAEARLEAQRAALRVQQLRLSQAQVLAPDDGIVSARSATLGAVVPAGQELFRLIRQGRLEWRAEVPGPDLAQIKPGQPARVLPSGGAAIAGRVRMVAPTVDVATRNGIVYVDLPASGVAKAGMFARGEFEIGGSRALTLPQSAVLLREGFSYVFRLGAGDKVALTKVQVGRRVGDRIEITGGLDLAARVVAQGAGFLADGDLVRVVAAPPTAAPAATTASR